MGEDQVTYCALSAIPMSAIDAVDGSHPKASRCAKMVFRSEQLMSAVGLQAAIPRRKFEVRLGPKSGLLVDTKLSTLRQRQLHRTTPRATPRTPQPFPDCWHRMVAAQRGYEALYVQFNRVGAFIAYC